jgi:hypothetical protein
VANPFVTDVALAGPFPKPQDPDTLSKTNWTKPVVGPPGKIQLPPTPKNQNTYLATQVESPSILKTPLLLGCSDPVTVWLNGKKIYEGKPGNHPALPDQAESVADLKKGTNQLLVRVTYQGDKKAIYLRFLDPQRKLSYAIPSTAP